MLTPSGKHKGTLQGEDMMVVDLQGNLLEGTGKVTKEYPLHRMIYEQRPEVGCVVHSHPVYGCVYAILGQPIPEDYLLQTKLMVGKIGVAGYAPAGSQALVEEVCPHAADCNLILLRNHGVVACGSAEIAYYLGLEECRSRQEPVLAIAGSLTPQTIAQVEYMRRKGYPVLELDTIAIAQGNGREMVQALEAEAGRYDASGDFLLIHTTQEAALVRKTKELAARRGLSNVEISGLISRTLAEVTERLCRKYRIRKCIVLGGDTSAAFCRSMEIQAMEIFEEIESGVPLLRKPNSNQYFVLKSGSFGTDAFIERAYQKLLSR